ncbi:HAD family hydrolase [Aquibacillus koreensis]|uniref:HAD family hydrolase n=1 Tax=Aquibacillus koreensis TaxID=279446 RepID=A0A9X4AJ58_9BACI|nr:HAD family hydrolase [Aquibacillus koreensis]MCT2534384.1 HAD family hydrolase [Aquibacillus koreensis]MDC3421691.1 HAD family hydrolase [Aquibacillus koreensis]
MLKLFATDLDGTLLQHNKGGNNIDKKDFEAIEDLVQSDVHFAIATGRMDRDIVEVLKHLNQSGHRISQNGGFVYDHQGQLVHSQTFSGELSKRLHTEIAKHTKLYCVTTEDDAFVTEKTGLIRAFEHLMYFPLKEGVDFIDEYGTTLHPTKFIVIGETDEILGHQKVLMEQFSGEAESYLSDNHCVDIVPKGISKADGLSHLMKHLDMAPDEIAVIGDSFNDVPMLEMTPYSYAMSTAHPDVQKKASKVVDYVYEAIEDLRAQKLF